MGKQDDARLAKLVKKLAGQPAKKSGREQAVQYDDTLKLRKDQESPETDRIFKEMKKREF